MNDPRSSNGRGGAAKQATATVSDLGTKRGEWKDLGEVSRGQQDISIHPASPRIARFTNIEDNIKQYKSPL